MAPRKPAPADKAKDPPAVKKSSIVKKPARGYHKSKNEMLNVEPKGDEKALVSSNQNSPLLRLPAELRNKIWEYALGGMEFRSYWSVFKPRPREATNVFALLRACREIYSETAPLSCSVNSFTISSYWRPSTSSFRSLQRYQINQIKEVRIAMVSPAMSMSFDQLKLDVLPELRRIRFCLFPDNEDEWDKMTFAEGEKLLRGIEPLTTWASSYDLIFEEMDMSLAMFSYM